MPLPMYFNYFFSETLTLLHCTLDFVHTCLRDENNVNNANNSILWTKAPPKESS